MPRADGLAEPLVGWLIRTSWQAAALAAIVLLIQWALRDRLAARWRYAMWVPVLMRLALPAGLESPYSPFHWLAAAPGAVAGWFDAVGPVDVSEGADAMPSRGAGRQLMPSLAEESETRATPPPGITWHDVAAVVWAIGAVLVALRVAICTIRLARRVGALPPVDDAAVLGLFDACRREMGVTWRIPIVGGSPGLGPALVGLWRPRLLLPADVAGGFGPAELRLVLLHELAHVRRRDLAMNWVLAVLGAVHWFNPVVWLVLARVRADRELAADEMVLSVAGPGAGATYGRTILKLLENVTRPPVATAAASVGLLEGPRQIRRRIHMIARYEDDDDAAAGSPNARSARRAALACAAVLALGLVAGTDAVGNDPAKPVPARAPAEPTRAAPVAPAPAMPAVAGADPAAAAPAAEPLIEPAAEDPETAQTRALLNRRLPEVNFQAIGFADVVDFLRDVTGANIFVNWRAMEGAGIDRSAPVTAQLRNVRFAKALETILADVGGGAVGLGYTVDGGVITITVVEPVAAKAVPRVYDVSDFDALKVTYEELAKVINTSVDVRSVSTLTEVGRLVINADERAHAEVEKLLDLLRADLKRGRREANAPARGGYTGGPHVEDSPYPGGYGGPPTQPARP